MDGIVSGVDSFLPIFLAVVVMAGGAAGMYALVTRGNPMPLMFTIAVMGAGWLYHSTFIAEDATAAWVAYRDNHCTKFDQKVVAGSDGQTIVGAAATSKGLTPAVGFTSGSADRIVTGWNCDNGRSYAESDGRTPSSFDPSQVTARTGG